MSEIDDGVIKYDRSFFHQTEPLSEVEYSELEQWRDQLFKIELIGEYKPEMVGYGNLSQTRDYSNLTQTPNPQFVITGTQTGKYPHLKGEHYTKVTDYCLESLKVVVYGPLEASSESLTHAAIYQSNHDIKAIFHIHSTAIWEGMIKENYPSTHQDIPYGTQEMAKVTAELVRKNSSGVFVMKGHQDGVVSYGTNLKEAGDLILELYHKFVR